MLLQGDSFVVIMQAWNGEDSKHGEDDDLEGLNVDGNIEGHRAAFVHKDQARQGFGAYATQAKGKNNGSTKTNNIDGKKNGSTKTTGIPGFILSELPGPKEAAKQSSNVEDPQATLILNDAESAVQSSPVTKKEKSMVRTIFRIFPKDRLGPEEVAQRPKELTMPPSSNKS